MFVGCGWVCCCVGVGLRGLCVCGCVCRLQGFSVRAVSAPGQNKHTHTQQTTTTTTTQHKHPPTPTHNARAPERRKHLRAKAADEAEAEARKVVLLDELVQVKAEQLEGDAQVRAERKVLGDVHDVVRVARVGGAQVLEHAQLDLRLVVEALFVADDLERAVLPRLVVEHLEHLAKRAAAEHGQHLVAARAVGV